jgi:hypothetical protein
LAVIERAKKAHSIKKEAKVRFLQCDRFGKAIF